MTGKDAATGTGPIHPIALHALVCYPQASNLSMGSLSGVIQNRVGSVLNRGKILKSDHFETAVNTQLDVYLQGAPNFRSGEYNIVGVAQPTLSGIATILTMLNCSPSSKRTADGRGAPTALWISSREEPHIYINHKPFVLREEASPLQNIQTYQGISASRLEQMEDRLKEDVLKEASKRNGLLLVHDEFENGRVVPSWMSADVIQTPKEVFAEFLHYGYRVQYIRIPISPEQAPLTRSVDEYVKLMSKRSLVDPLVFNCGMGVGRTTFAMVMATLLRRGQYKAHGISPEMSPELGTVELRTLGEIEAQNRAVLRLVTIIDNALGSRSLSGSAVETALARGGLLDDLKNASRGNYQCILQLLGLFPYGQECKQTVDAIIDRCNSLIRYSVTGNNNLLERALGCLERYMMILVFSAFVRDTSEAGFKYSFTGWLNTRPEIARMMEGLKRKGTHAQQLDLFRPVQDLSTLLEPQKRSSMAMWTPRPASSTIPNELENSVIKSRQGAVLVPYTILKADYAGKEYADADRIEGAPNFRQVLKRAIYSVAQPSINGVNGVLQNVAEAWPSLSILWINLREEPLVYINGTPYVLRDNQYKNVRSYAGITSARLELLEFKLKEDVVDELTTYDNKVLLHLESNHATDPSSSQNGPLQAIWEDCVSIHTQTFKDVVEVIQKDTQSSLQYVRLPLVSDAAPDPSDFDTFVRVLSMASVRDKAIVLNCRTGTGASATATVITSLILHWLNGDKPTLPTYSKPGVTYKVIHSLLRVIRNGLECKRVVDAVVDACATPFLHLRNAIEQCRVHAEQAAHEDVSGSNLAMLDSRSQREVRKGLTHLKRYFYLIAFQAYLDQFSAKAQVDVEALPTFASWVHGHAEFESMLEEMNSGELDALVPVELLSPGDGIALTTEVLDVVNTRHGEVLARHTILKYDMFPGCQKLSLPERIDGAPNFRQIMLPIVRSTVFEDTRAANLARRSGPPSAIASPDAASEGPPELMEQMTSVSGAAMPTKDAIRRVLTRLGAAPSSEERRTVLWTSLREEPVIYVNGRPFVLRMFSFPLKNIEATGIARERVERMESRMKWDVVDEIHKYDGRVLLHEEQKTDGPGGYSILPVWETVAEGNIQTPSEVFSSIRAEGYRVDYLRIPMYPSQTLFHFVFLKLMLVGSTDEQAPIPDVFDQLVERVMRVGGSTDAIFNCQMGRGRTTTGMVITCLMEMIVGNEPLLSMTPDALDDLMSAGLKPVPSEIALSGGPVMHEPASVPNSSADVPRVSSFRGASLRSSGAEEDDMQRYKQGEYRLILQLLSVLNHGKLAKYLTDRAIDVCDSLQNLRVSIMDYRLRVLAAGGDVGPSASSYGWNPSTGTQKRESVTFNAASSPVSAHAKKVADLLQVGLNYLVRYFYIIVFADYLLEEMVSKGRGNPVASPVQSRATVEKEGHIRLMGHPRKPFSEWLKERNEILHLIRPSNQGLD